MIIKHNYSIKSLTTFGVPVKAKKYIRIENAGELNELHNIINRTEKCLIIGGGSNILFTKDFQGTVIHPVFNNITTDSISSGFATVSAEAGMNWDRFVEWTVNNDFGGLETLSYIPGNVGASPVQNIGAYGTEVSGFITEVQAFSMENGEIKTFENKECNFGYRDSIFKNRLKGKYLITKVIFRLIYRPAEFNLSYEGLEKIVSSSGDRSLTGIRNAVISIRKKKLPDPAVAGNAGSFFKNPVITMNQLIELRKKFPGMPSWEMNNKLCKIPAAWLIEKAGWKGKRSGQAGVYNDHALILVNLGNASGKEILKLSEQIRSSVKEMFGLNLEPEVNIYS